MFLFLIIINKTVDLLPFDLLRSAPIAQGKIRLFVDKFNAPIRQPIDKMVDLLPFGLLRSATIAQGKIRLFVDKFNAPVK